MNISKEDKMALVLVCIIVGTVWLVSNLAYHSQPHLSDACQQHMDCTAEDRALLESHGGGVAPGLAIWVKQREDMPGLVEIIIALMKPFLDCIGMPLAIFIAFSVALSLFSFLIKR